MELTESFKRLLGIENVSEKNQLENQKTKSINNLLCVSPAENIRKVSIEKYFFDPTSLNKWVEQFHSI